MIGTRFQAPFAFVDAAFGARILPSQRHEVSVTISPHNLVRRIATMMDAVMLAIGFVFFALSIAYVYACDRL